MATVGLIGHEDYLKHDTGEGHPERPDRLRAIHDHLQQTGLNDDLTKFEPRHADVSWLEKAHKAEHVANVQSRCIRGLSYMEDFETMISPQSFDIARLAVGATFEAVDVVMNQKADTVFCAIRPPGHHAEYDRAMGFCLFSNVVITARYIQETYNLNRIAIIDWDVHHGNGTQHILDRDPSVFYFSIHQYPHYPGTGRAEEKGLGPGEGYTLNVPVPSGSDDAAYLRSFDEKLMPAMDQFKPEFVIISAGFDAHIDDPLSGTRVTENGFAEMTRRLMTVAKTHANNRLISVLEGGYDLGGLSRSVATHIQTLMEGSGD